MCEIHGEKLCEYCLLIIDSYYKGILRIIIYFIPFIDKNDEMNLIKVYRNTRDHQSFTCLIGYITFSPFIVLLLCSVRFN